MTSLEPDRELGEVLTEDEESVAREIAAVMRANVTRDYPAGVRPAQRDAHPKAHGCVRAEFRVRDDLSPTFAHGVFVPGRRYNAWVRFSSGDGNPRRPDGKGDSHGMAIKLMGVPGAKLLAEEKDAETQDFLMIDHPVFIIDDARRYLTLLRRSNSPRFLTRLLAPFATGIRGTLIARAISTTKVASLLETRYWSTTPSRLGLGPQANAIKFSARPTLVGRTAMPSHPGPSYLRETLIKELSERDAEFEFLVQPRTRPSMSVERTSVEWAESEAPFHRVATITIPKQTFATPARDAFGENLSFTPWHALPEHRPLGGVNRVRRVVYEEISRLRHELNGARRTEPVGDELVD